VRWRKHVHSRKCTGIGSVESSVLLGAIVGEMLSELLLLKHGLVLPEPLFPVMCLLRLWKLFESYRAG